MTHRPSLACAGLAALAWAGGAAAQQPADSEWVALSRYDEATSRRAFAACDADGDDRLDVRECLRALTNMGTLREPAGFRALDANRDGFAHWDEFDRRYQRIVKQGTPFRVRPLHRFAIPKAAQNPSIADRTRQAVALLQSMANTDDDPHIDKTEFGRLLTALKQPATAISLFPALDTDGSGALSEAELVPVVQKVPILLQLAAGGPAGGAAQVVREPVLAERLRRLHPTLGRFSKTIFANADRDADGGLSEAELGGSK
jgi:Ca2+-binding EF-hand superfamily protein